MINEKSLIFPILILNARPAAGKSEIIEFLKNIPDEERFKDFHIGKIKVIDDFPFLWRWFEEDAILTKTGHPRLFTDEKGYFKYPYLWDLLIHMINLEYEKFIKNSINNHDYTIIIEFSRGKEHGGYQRALPNLSSLILESGVLMYVDVSWEESLRKNRARFNPSRPDSILEHSLSEEKMLKLYSGCDFHAITLENKDYLTINSINLPYTVFNNWDDVTSGSIYELDKRLNSTLDYLWNNYQTNNN